VATPAQLRNGEQALAQLAANDLAAMWRQVNNAVEARKALQDILPALLRAYGAAAATLAADWYDEARAAAEVGGAFTAIPADLGDQGADALALWATSKGTDLDAIRGLVEGGLTRRVLTWSRETVQGSALADPRADGWQRIGVGSCPFCAMLIGRGAVYTEATSHFASHDHCHCSAVPAFKGKPRPVDKVFRQSMRRRAGEDGKASPADKARVRDWLAAHENA
jgi:hypothetical protein